MTSSMWLTRWMLNCFRTSAGSEAYPHPRSPRRRPPIPHGGVFGWGEPTECFTGFVIDLTRAGSPGGILSYAPPGAWTRWDSTPEPLMNNSPGGFGRVGPVSPPKTETGARIGQELTGVT